MSFPSTISFLEPDESSVNLDNDRDSSTLFIYSLSRQAIIHQVELNGHAVSFESNAHFIVIVRTHPHAHTRFLFLTPTLTESDKPGDTTNLFSYYIQRNTHHLIKFSGSICAFTCFIFELYI